MRTWGRIVPNILYPDVKQWVEVTTDANGFNDAVWLTTLAQTIQLNLGESPFFANYGIPAHPAQAAQVPPDFYMYRTQQQFAPHFMMLLLTSVPNAVDADGIPAPSYRINCITTYGSKISVVVPV